MKSLASTSKNNRPIVIIAHSARAMAECAVRAGHWVVAVDGFADMDTLAVSSECWCLPLVDGEFDRHKLLGCLAHLGTRFPHAQVVAGSGCEPYVTHMETIAGWQLLGNTADCIQRICTPEFFFAALDQLSIPYPAVSFVAPPSSAQDWLCKTPLRSGGLGVQRGDAAAGAGHYWQRTLGGVSISALCLAQHGRAAWIGINRLYTCTLAENLPYVYSGAESNYTLDKKIYDKIVSYTNNLIDHFELIGLCSIDMLLAENELWVLEVNPRVSATFELYRIESAATNLIDAHIRVCEGERLSDLAVADQSCANAIIYADGDYITPAISWPDWSSDRPEAGRRLQKFDPICSVRALSGQAEDLYNSAQKKGQQILSLIKQSNNKTN